MSAFDGRALLLLILLGIPAVWLIRDWSRRNVDRHVSRALDTPKHSTLWNASDPEQPAREAGDRLGFDEYPTREDRS